MEGQEIQPGVMPASFRVRREGSGEEEHLLPDFGDRAIGRVSPVDAMMWWMVLLHAFARRAGPAAEGLLAEHEIQHSMRLILNLCLKGSFEVYPTLLVPDASCMIDRRMGVHGHPLEIQALFYATLHTAAEFFRPGHEHRRLCERAARRQQLLRDYVRGQYWLDGERLSAINRFATEEFGAGTTNMLNIYPESIPDWVESWLPARGGYLVGNLGPGRMDVRYFALGNLLAIVFGLASEEQAHGIMDLYEERWSDLVGTMPAKLCYPALEGEEWRLLTGSDPKNEPWSYHNGGNWPVLLWALVAAALVTRRRELAERAVADAEAKLPAQGWPEYYDGRGGRMIGRRANLGQVWSAAGYILSRRLLEDPELLSMFPGQPALEHI